MCWCWVCALFCLANLTALRWQAGRCAATLHLQRAPSGAAPHPSLPCRSTLPAAPPCPPASHACAHTCRSPLQLACGTVLLVDETPLGEGRLSEAGITSFSTLSTLVQQQVTARLAAR